MYTYERTVGEIIKLFRFGIVRNYVRNNVRIFLSIFLSVYRRIRILYVTRSLVIIANNTRFCEQRACIKIVLYYRKTINLN